MIEIPDPPAATACYGCGLALSWVWSPRRHDWVALVPAAAGTFTLHRCRDRGTAPSWRDMPHRRAADVHAAAAEAKAVVAAALNRLDEGTTDA